MDQTHNTEHTHHNHDHLHAAMKNVRRNQIIIAVLAFILGFVIAGAIGMHRRPFMMKGDYRNNGGMMERRGGQRMMNPNQMPQGGAMMESGGQVGVPVPAVPAN